MLQPWLQRRQGSTLGPLMAGEGNASLRVRVPALGVEAGMRQVESRQANRERGTMSSTSDCIWLITGIPGSGKTSVSKALSERLPRSAHIEVDRLREMIISGYLAPGQEPLAESDAQLELGAQNGALLADSFMTKGFTPVVDDVILRLQLTQYREALSRWPLRLVVLASAIEVALERDRQRAEKHVAARFAYLDEELRAQMQGLGLWLDTSAMDIAETVEAIIQRAEEASLESFA